jgi:hypothetical protein
MTLEKIALLVNIAVAIVTGGLAFSTFLVARATKRAAEATEKTIEAQYKPWVVMYAKPNWQGNTIDIVVKNVGYGPAYDISFNLPEYFPCNARGPAADGAPKPANWEGGPLRNGMSYLAAGEMWRTYWGQYGGLLAGLDNKPLEVVVTFKTAKGVIERSTCVLDVRDLEEYGIANFEQKTVQALKEQNESLKLIANRLSHHGCQETNDE